MSCDSSQNVLQTCHCMIYGVLRQKVYKEMGDGQVKEALVSLLKTEEGVLSELLIDREAVEHTVRLCRVLVSQHISTVEVECMKCLTV